MWCGVVWEQSDLVLNLHGEMMSSLPNASTNADGSEAISLLNAESMFLPQLLKLHAAFPRLRIVLEHVSTRQGLDAVRQCGPTVVGRITSHHLWMTVIDWCQDVFSVCKPVAKRAADHVALKEDISQGWINKEELSLGSIGGFFSGYGRGFYSIPRLKESSQSRFRLEKKRKPLPEVIQSANLLQ